MSFFFNIFSVVLSLCSIISVICFGIFNIPCHVEFRLSTLRFMFYFIINKKNPEKKMLISQLSKQQNSSNSGI